MPAEGRSFTDRKTGVATRQLTDWRAHSYHLYFTSSGLWDNGRRLVFASERDNAPNLYSVELASGEITQLTDFPAGAEAHLIAAGLNPKRDELYVVVGRELLAVDPRTLEQRVLLRACEGYIFSALSCTADGRTVCISELQDLTAELKLDLMHGYVGFAEYSAARPHCRIWGVDVGVPAPAAGSASPASLLHEEKFWLGHINTSPTQPDLLTFCHEGPWHTISQRMWMLSISRRQAQPLRAQSPGELVGHEYWFADGQRVGYHGATGDGPHKFGWVRWDNAEQREFDFSHNSSHFHSADERFIVADGTREHPYLLLWRLASERYEGPRLLAWHRGSSHVQVLHTHPHVYASPDGRLRVTYTADPNGYGNVFMVEVPEFESLPEAAK